MDRTVDAPEKFIRFGCGALIGLGLGVWCMIEVAETAVSRAVFIAVAVVLAAVSGILAVKQGARFFHRIHEWFE